VIVEPLYAAPSARLEDVAVITCRVLLAELEALRLDWVLEDEDL
jgi:hypothetical protein